MQHFKNLPLEMKKLKKSILKMCHDLLYPFKISPYFKL